MRPEDDWTVDTEGNLSSPGEGDLQPSTDEFGRDDPAALERERRRREREERRRGGSGKRRAVRRKKAPKRAAAPAAEQPAPPTAESAPSSGPSMPRRAAAGRGLLRERIARGRGGGGGRRGGGGGDAGSRGPGHYRRRRFIALAAALVAVLGAWFLVAFFQPFAGDGEGEGSVTVEIPEGASAADIAEILDSQEVVSSGRLFEWRLKLAGKADEIQADTYTLASGMSYGTAIERLTAGETGGAITVTIPEGLSRDQIASDVLPEGVSSDEYLALTESAPQGFNPARYGARGTSIEGFLFPATYELGPNQGAGDLVSQQLAAFEQNFAGVNLAAAKKKNLTPYDVLTIASMIDKEVQIPKERPLVAAVIYNRLSQGIPLGIDATTRYETRNYDEQIPQSDLDADTPYNTRRNQGLPPTPIGNPGLEAIKAAAKPANVPFTYFVVKPGTCGEHSFTASEAEFEQLAREYQAALEAEGGSPTECE